jgi:ADP-heptose:LPS heptosyltransferase
VTGFIGNDAGITHLAAFLGLPCVAIFGPADPERWTPVGRSTAVVRAPVDCEPCFELLPENCDGDAPECLFDTQPETVMHVFKKLLVQADEFSPPLNKRNGKG